MRFVSAALVALALASCVPDSTTPEPGPVTKDPIVSLENTSFMPNAVTVQSDTTVTWEWKDDQVQHDVVFEEVRSDIQASGTFQHTFEEPGTYEYVCSLHPNMKGTVFVVDPAT